MTFSRFYILGEVLADTEGDLEIVRKFPVSIFTPSSEFSFKTEEKHSYFVEKKYIDEKRSARRQIC